MLRPGPGHHGRAARPVGSTGGCRHGLAMRKLVRHCRVHAGSAASFAAAGSLRPAPVRPARRRFGHDVLPAGWAGWFFRLLAIMRSLVVHFQVGGALPEPDIFRRSRRNAAAARHEAGGIGGGGNAVTDIRARDLIAELDEASLSRFHLRAVLASGMGFFTDAYDLFVIGIASALITKDWNLSSGKLALLNSTMLFAAFIGAFVFGRFADVIGRKRVYWIVAAIMIAGALGSALSPSFWVLIGFRFVLGVGVGGDYPVSAVMVSEYANRKDRGKLVGMVFGTQALGLIVGPLVALALLGSGT